MPDLKLFMLLVGCRPLGRNTEQHDVFFGIGEQVKDLIIPLQESWKNSGTLHIDAWREITRVDEFTIQVFPKEQNNLPVNGNKLFFINLGGYKQDEFEEFHYKMLAVGNDKSEAIHLAKKSAFYKHTGFKGAESHIDDKYGVDIDDVFQIKDILPEPIKMKYQLVITQDDRTPNDEIHLGYFKLSNFE